MKRTYKHLAQATGISLILASCGAPPPPAESIAHEDAHGCSEKVVPPKEYYDALVSERVSTLSLAASTNPHTMYLNFNGVDLEKGFGRGQSFILCEETASIPGSGFSFDEQQEIVQRVKQHFSDAGVALDITTTRPLSGDYTTIHVGGSYGSLGCPESPSTLGIAPFDEGNQNRNDIGFVFTAYQIDPGTIADTIAHESGHSFGLDHTINIKDLMHSSAQSDDLAFAISQIRGSTDIQDGPKMLRRNVGALPNYVDPGDATNGGASGGGASSGGNSGNGSVNPGSGNGGSGGLFSGINTLGGLLNQLQPDQILNIMSLLPGFASMVPGISNGTTSPFPGGNYTAVLSALPGLDKINTLVAMAAPGLTNAAGSAGFDPASIATLVALAAFGGYGSVPAALLGANSALGPLMAMIFEVLGMNLANSGTLPDPNQIAAQLPPYLHAYGLGGYTTAPALLSAMTMQALYIQSTYSGAQQQALLSGLKVATSQAYLLMNQ